MRGPGGRQPLGSHVDTKWRCIGEQSKKMAPNNQDALKSCTEQATLANHNDTGDRNEDEKMPKLEEKIAKAKERERRARQRLAQLKRIAGKSERKIEDTRKFLVGSAILSWTDIPPEIEAKLIGRVRAWARPGDPRLAALVGTMFEILDGEM